MSRKKCHVYILQWYPEETNHDSRIINVYCSRRGARRKKKRLQDRGWKGEWSILKFSVQGTCEIYRPDYYQKMDMYKPKFTRTISFVWK